MGIQNVVFLFSSTTKTEILWLTQDAVVNIKGQGLADITIKELLEAGAHFGHQKRRWNPKMMSYDRMYGPKLVPSQGTAPLSLA